VTEAPDLTTEVVRSGYPSPLIPPTLELQTTVAVPRPARPGKPGHVVFIVEEVGISAAGSTLRPVAVATDKADAPDRGAMAATLRGPKSDPDRRHRHAF
jgi:hypothetical protein